MTANEPNLERALLLRMLEGMVPPGSVGRAQLERAADDVLRGPLADSDMRREAVEVLLTRRSVRGTPLARVLSFAVVREILTGAAAERSALAPPRA